jgi:hypothetical protein
MGRPLVDMYRYAQCVPHVLDRMDGRNVEVLRRYGAGDQMLNCYVTY